MFLTLRGIRVHTLGPIYANEFCELAFDAILYIKIYDQN